MTLFKPALRVLALSAFGMSAASAQDTTGDAASNQLLKDMAVAAGQDGSAQLANASPELQSWMPIGSNLDTNEIVKRLSVSGWQEGKVEAAVPSAGNFDLFSRALAPGVNSYLAVPKSGGTAIEFAPGLVQQASLTSYSADTIKEQILAGMKYAIDALCSMDPPPNEIRVKASAAGVVEVEATWQTSEVCKSKM